MVVIKNVNKRILGTIAVLAFLILINGPVSKANPIIPPPIITELYFSDDGWIMEMVFTDFGSGALDSIRLVGLYDTAMFNPGILVVAGEVIVITNEDMQSPFFIDPLGDYVFLEECFSSQWFIIDWYGLTFGEVPEPNISWVTAPVGEESVACQEFLLYDPWYPETFYWTVKEKPNSIGSDPLEVNKKALFQGMVLDQQLNPLPEIRLIYCDEVMHYGTIPTVPYVMTDDTGFFYADDMFCRKYHFIFIRDIDPIWDTVVSVEPDSNNYFEFVLDTLLLGIPEIDDRKSVSLYNYPNPFSENTKIIAELPFQPGSSEAIIKIYNTAGELLAIKPMHALNGSNTYELELNTNTLSLKPGTYICSFEMGHKRLASSTMILAR